MKPSYKGFEAKKAGGFIELPAPGAYVAEIQNVRFVPADPIEGRERDQIELMMEITEGEYAGRYMDFYNYQKERFGDSVKYRGVFRLVCPLDNDEDWRKRTFEGNLWCVVQSNPDYAWDWDETKLKGKKVGISVRERLYTSGDADRSTTEIAKFETIEDVRAGKVKLMKVRDQRTSKTESTDGNNMTDVSKTVDVPW